MNELKNIARELTPVYATTGVHVPNLYVQRAEDMHKLIKSIYAIYPSDYEIATAFYFTTQNTLIGYQVVGVGSANAVILDPKKVFAGALSVGAHSIIVCHNHPSGNQKASDHDIRQHNKIREASKFLDIHVLDCMILAGNEIISH